MKNEKLLKKILTKGVNRVRISSGKKEKRFIVWIIVVIAVLFLLAVSVAGCFLKSGVNISSLAIGGIVVSDCALIWRNKLELRIAKVEINKTDKFQATPADLQFARKGVEAGYYLPRFFSRLSIGAINIGEKYFAVDLIEENSQSQALVIKSQEIVLKFLLTNEKDSLQIEIVEAYISRYNSSLKGKLQIDGPNGRATGTVSSLINGSFPVTLDFIADQTRFSFHGKEYDKITEIASIVNCFGLNRNIQRWITDYLSGSRYHLEYFKGTFPWDNPKELLATFEAKIKVDDTEYTFAPGLEPVKAGYTDVFFQKGILVIKPHDTTFYGQDGGDSWVDIDFNDPKNILLSVNIKTHAVANDDILTLLNYYKISLPFKQIVGKTAVDLRLLMILNKQKIDAQGIFEIDDGVIEWGGRNFHAENALIELVDSNVSIQHLNISYENMFTAQIAGVIRTKEKSGDLDISLEQFSLELGKSLLGLDATASAPVQARYHFDLDGHILEAQPSSWLLDSLNLKLGAFRATVFPGKLAIEMPPVSLEIPPGILLEVSGNFSLSERQAYFSCDLLEYHVNDLELISPHVMVDIGYDQGIIVSTEETTLWQLNKMPVTFYPSIFTYGDGIFTLDKSRISYGSFFDSSLTGYYNKTEQQGKFTLQKIDIKDNVLQTGIEIGSDAEVELSGVGETYTAYFPELDLKISTDEEKNWSAVFSDLSKIYNRSTLQRKFNIKKGSLAISSVNGKMPYFFSADIEAPYPLFIDGNKPVEMLSIKGRLAEQGVFAKINEQLDIEYADQDLAISSDNLGYNVPALLSMLDKGASAEPDNVNKDSDKDKRLHMSLMAKDSFLYFNPKCRVMADEMVLEYADNEYEMKISHGSGTLEIHSEGKSFLAQGEGLNDNFMRNLIQAANFSGGETSITAKGEYDRFSVIFEVKNTVLHNLKIVNNVMALINTLPALMNFSLPEYSSTGLKVDSAVVGMRYDKKLVTIESLDVQTSEVHAAGAGWIDFAKSLIDLDIFLTPGQAGKNISKIPVVGYVVAGEEDAPSVTLKIKGNLKDPDVSTSFLKEIIALPSDMLHRTLNVPLNFLRKDRKSKGKE